jgi:hypothetical protein
VELCAGRAGAGCEDTGTAEGGRRARAGREDDGPPGGARPSAVSSPGCGAASFGGERREEIGRERDEFRRPSADGSGGRRESRENKKTTDSDRWI